jgi:protein-tyrosine phosphatase
MAKGFLERLLSEKKSDIRVQAAGTVWSVWGGPTRGAIRAMDTYGIDISSYTSVRISRDLIDQADLILAMAEAHRRKVIDMEPAAARKVFLLKEFAGSKEDLEIPDPIGRSYEAYQSVAREIKEAIEIALPKIIDFVRTDK